MSPRKPRLIRNSEKPKGRFFPFPERGGHQKKTFQPHPDQDDPADNQHQPLVSSWPSGSKGRQKGRQNRDQYGPGQVFPGSAIDPGDNKTGLFGKVAIPDDQKLGKEKIPGNQTKTQEQLSQIVELSSLDEIPQLKGLNRKNGKEDQTARAL